MKQCWITYSDEWSEARCHLGSLLKLTGVHGVMRRSLLHRFLAQSRPVPGKGFPTFHVEFDGFTFAFASLDELDICLETLSKKLLPTSLQLAAKRGTGVGPNSHWLSRLPAKVKPWRYREKAVKYLAKARGEFLDELSTC